MSLILLAIDPGEDTGWAVFVDNYLQVCGCTKPNNLKSDVEGTSPVGYSPASNISVVIECPQKYPHDNVDPNRLIVLARKVGRYEEMFRAATVRLTSPHSWKGSVPKDVMTCRIEKHMSVSERQILESSNIPKNKIHNTVDAIGLGKWCLQQKGIFNAL